MLFTPMENASREELERFQWKKVKDALERSYHNSKFYKRLLDKAGARPEQIRSWKEFREKVPIIGKQDLLEDQEASPPYGERLQCRREDVKFTLMTSGTSGIGQEVYSWNLQDMVPMAVGWGRLVFWSGYRPGDIHLDMLPTNLTLAFPKSMVIAEHLLGVHVLHVGSYTTRQKLEMVKRFGPVAGFTASPAYLTHLMEVSREMGSDVREIFKGLKYIQLVFQNYDPEWVWRMKEAWGGPRITEGYGCSQFGTGAGATCGDVVIGNKRRMIHFFEDCCLYEVLNKETRQPVEFGEEGEVVLTSFSRHASPVIRFAMQDRVRLMPHYDCDCGKPFNGAECGNVRRYDDMMKIRGMNVWPSAVDLEVLKNTDVLEYQGRVFLDNRGNEEVKVMLEIAEAVPPAEKTALISSIASSLQERTGIRITVEQSPEKLPRFEFKPLRWKDERSAAN